MASDKPDQGLLKGFFDLVDRQPRWFQIFVGCVILGLIALAIWSKFIAPARPLDESNDFRIAYDREAHGLRPKDGGPVIAARIDYLMGIATTDSDRCDTVFLYLDVAQGTDAQIPASLKAFIESEARGGTPCVVALKKAADAAQAKAAVASTAGTVPAGTAAAQVLHVAKAAPNATTAPGSAESVAANARSGAGDGEVRAFGDTITFRRIVDAAKNGRPGQVAVVVRNEGPRSVLVRLDPDVDCQPKTYIVAPVDPSNPDGNDYYCTDPSGQLRQYNWTVALRP